VFIPASYLIASAFDSVPASITKVMASRKEKLVHVAHPKIKNS
jgi:hypothetical protein